MKQWRLQAGKMKAKLQSEGKHVKGARYGRTIKTVLVKIFPVPSTLFQVLCIRAGYIKGETQ